MERAAAPLRAVTGKVPAAPASKAPRRIPTIGETMIRSEAPKATPHERLFIGRKLVIGRVTGVGTTIPGLEGGSLKGNASFFSSDACISPPPKLLKVSPRLWRWVQIAK